MSPVSAWQATTSSQALTLAGEGVDALAASWLVQLHPHERLQAQAQPLRIDFGAVAGDHPVALQPLHPAQAGRRRQVHALGQLGVGQAAVALQLGEQRQVGAVERRSGHFLPFIFVYDAGILRQWPCIAQFCKPRCAPLPPTLGGCPRPAPP